MKQHKTPEGISPGVLFFVLFVHGLIQLRLLGGSLGLFFLLILFKGRPHGLDVLAPDAAGKVVPGDVHHSAMI